MKVSKILIKGFQQFENFQLDLTNPETGEPLEKICLIGPNGTGKSTLLALVLSILRNCSQGTIDNSQTTSFWPSTQSWPQNFYSANTSSDTSLLAVKLHTASGRFIAQASANPEKELVFYDATVEFNDDWIQFWKDAAGFSNRDFCRLDQLSEVPFSKLSSLQDLIIYEPADQVSTLSDDPPIATLNSALAWQREFPIFHVVSVASASSFWKILIYLINKWQSDYLSFLHEPANRDRSIRQLEAEFSQSHQKILPKIAELWDRILGKCGLEFDLKQAIAPVQLDEGLQAYVKSKNTDQQLQYNQLSSGIRNYIFKLGYIKSLYFDRQIKRGFLLIDEPENCLYPDLLYDLMDDYWSIIENTQTFVSTHSPIVAAQFEPYERFHLDFDDRGYVTATRGVSPIGDDPNDLLYRDFQVRSIYGKKGLEKWNRYLELRRLIPETLDPETKRSQMQEYLAIGNAYNFDPQ